MCPSVHELGDDIRHDIVLKMETEILQKIFKKGFNLIALKSLSSTQTGVPVESKTPVKFPIHSSPHSTLTLFILSTIRLIL